MLVASQTVEEEPSVTVRFDDKTLHLVWKTWQRRAYQFMAAATPASAAQRGGDGQFRQRRESREKFLEAACSRIHL